MEEEYLDYFDIDGMIRWYLDGKTPEGREKQKQFFEKVKFLNSKVEWIEE